jgi:tricorn protease
MRSTLIILSFILSTITIALGNNHFLSHPCLSPSGDKVVFSYEGDLWIAKISDGVATRLTAMQGYETNPRISPDGKWLAFTGRQYSNADVFIMPLEGGPITQLTYHSGNDEMANWDWDSQSIYFTSTRTGQISSYQVGINGGTPKRVFGEFYFQYDHLPMPHPTTGEIFLNDTWESSNQIQRKRYKGPFNPDIQSYNVKTKKYKKYTTWEGKDFGVTIDKNGRTYFISDENNGQYNLYQLFNDKKTALTQFESSIKFPFVNANGGSVVFEKDYKLWIYSTNDKKAKELDIKVFNNSILDREKDSELKNDLSYFDISPDGKKMLMVSRGELFISDIEGKFIQEYKRKDAERVREAKWLADNKSVIYSQTQNGYTNWYKAALDKDTFPTPLGIEDRSNRSITLNKKRTMAVYLSGRDELRLMDLTTLTSKTISKQEIWGFQNSQPQFSPNDEYVLFTGKRNFEEDIFIHHIKNNVTTNLTNTDITESDPYWSNDGKYIYFTSQRLKPSYPFGMPNAKVYKLALARYDEEFKSDKYKELFTDTAKQEKPKLDSTTKPIVIEVEDLMKRMERISPSLGSQSLQAVFQKGDKTFVFYTSNHDEGKTALWKTVIEPFEQNKTEKIAGIENIFGVDIIEVKDKYYALANNTIYKLSLDANKADPITISHEFRRNLKGEFNQMFEEAWAQMEAGFYDEKHHGNDWKKTKTYYAQFLPYLTNRADLRTLLNDMLGELNASHQGFNTFGSEETTPLANRTMETGILFDNDNPLKVKSVLKNSNADKLNIDIKPGDILVKVNEEAIDPKKDRNAYFTLPSLDKEIKLTFDRNGKQFTTKIHPQTSISNQLYDEWIHQNQEAVNKKSNNKIAYGYMKDMGSSELEDFIIDMTQELNKKTGLILDLRYNRGGNVHNEVLQFLSQKHYINWQYRGGGLSPQPNFIPASKPIVLLINEQSLSDAEVTAEGFKALKLGKIVGNSTYKWIIFTSGVGLVDGSSVRMPSWGCYALDGTNLEFNGVNPDIKIINTFEDKINGRDPQLDKAIETVLESIKK